MSDTSTRHILHAVAKDAGKVHSWIVAIFPNEKLMRSYRAICNLAYAAGNAEFIAKVDPNHHTTADGKPMTGVKFSMSIAPYNPSPSLDDDEPEPPASK